METRASHVLIGAFVLLVVAVAVLFVLWLGRLSLDREWDRYLVVFEESVTGLSVGSAVYYSGIQVGEVRELELDPVDPRIALATIRVRGGTPVKADTGARLTFTGVTGVAAIQLSGGTPSAAPLRPGPAGGLPRIVAETSAFQSLLSGGTGMLEGINTLVLRLSVLLGDDNLAAISATLSNAERFSGTLAAREVEIDRFVADLAEASAMLRTTLARVDGAASEAERLLRDDLPVMSASAQAALGSLERAAAGIETLIEENREAVGRFTHDGLADVEPTLEALQAALVPLRRLVERLEQQPGLVLQPTTPPRELPAP
ncbi:MAG: MlaD family protein [Pseudomonadales bacterium]|jgi:phospholipid/cholesterol/gamma-HCH transport system substrate-binding protein|nr:MlaD family protein [Pseudomonadales bacterium]